MADNSVKFLTGSISDLQAKNTNGTPKVPIVPGRVYFAVDTNRNYGYIAYDVSASQRLVMSTRAELSDRVSHDLTLGDKSYNGSADVDILGSDLHRLSASNYLGITNTNITTSPGITTASVYIIAEKKNKTAVVGNLVIYNNKEYYWSGGAGWKPVGTASFKLRQNPISSPSASSSTISFIDTISQDENGIITATKKTVRNATASQSGVVTTTEQTFSGLKIFNNGIKLGSNINMGDAGTPSSYPFVGNKITWTGGTDGAEIYYRLDSSDAGRLFLNMTDDTNALIALAYNGTAKSYVNPSTPSFYPATSNTGSLGTSSNKWANIYATTIHGSLDGNASTATNATTATNLAAAGTWTWANGTTAGPTATLVLGGKTTNVGAVPSASTSQSGIITTGAQSFAGVKTFTNKIVLKDGNQAGAQIGAAYITTASTTNGEVVLQNGHLRFGGSDWDYNQWAGLKYDHVNKKIVLGLADGSEFTANSAQSGGTFKLAGISTVDLNKTASIRNLAIGGGIYWNPYVESSSDGSDAASITVLKSGTAGGTELRIQQANDSTDIINLVSPSYIYFNSKQAFQINDSWLRINPSGGFSSGTLFSRLLRADAELQARDIGLYNANQFRTGRWYNVATGTAGDGSNSGTMGAVYLELGNGTAQSAASGAGGGNAKGYLRLYGSSTAVGTLEFDNTYFRPSADIYFVNNSSSTSGWANGVRGQVGANDYWRVGGGATGSNAGYMEIATADDANEPIYVRQYSGVFGTLNTTLTLLDASHNTIIPNALTVGTTSSQAANYKFYVNGTSYFNGNTTHNGIDYFANGTTYYINNSADANLRRGIFSGTSNGDTAASSFFNTGALEIREAGRAGNGQTSFNYAPRIGFHWSGRIAGSLSFHNDGIFYFRKQNGTDRATIDANVNGNSSTATQFASNKSITLSGDVSGSASSKGGWSITTSIGAGKVTNAMLAGSIENGKLINSKITLAGNDVSLGGSLSADTLRTSLGLSNALHFIGIATVAITDGSTTDPKISGYTIKTSGDVIIDKDSAYEYIWTGAKWERLGGDSSYKVIQSAVADPAASGTSNTFIATISQDANGKITATKKTVAVTNNAPTLAWGTTSTIGTVAGTSLQVKMPANPNVDTKVTQTVTTSNAAYPLLLAPSGQTATTTTTAYFDSGVTLNPSTNTIAANISGNALTVGQGNDSNTDKDANDLILNTPSKLTFYSFNTNKLANIPSGGSNWGYLTVGSYSGNYNYQTFIDGYNGTTWTRILSGGTWGAWKTTLDSNNYTNYTVTKTGGGASGTWGINISGNASTSSLSGVAERLDSFDTRSATRTPQDTPRGITLNFKQNSTYSLSDGGSYIGLLSWRSYSTAGDLSGGYPIEIAYTQNGNLWTRLGSSSTAWGSWRKILDSSNYTGTLDSRYVKKSGDTMTGNLTAPSVYTSNWFRSTGKTGWYSETYGGGLYMTDSTYIRNYGGKSVRLDNLCLGADNNSYRLYVNGSQYIQTSSANSANNGLIINNGLLSIVNYGNTLTIGSSNSSWAHFSSSKPFWFSNSVQINGNLLPYIDGTQLTGTKTLGDSAHRWKSLYVGTADSYGSATVPVYWNNGVPTAITSYSGNAATATKWQTARNFITNLGSETAALVDGSTGPYNLGVTGILPITHGGTGVTSIAEIKAGKDSDGNTIKDTYLKRYRNSNTYGSGYTDLNGTMPPFLQAYKNGYPLHTDPEFASGNNGISLYDNAGSGKTAIERIDMACGNSTGKVLRIRNIGSGPSPYLGGWYFGDITAYARQYVCIFRAKAPVGYTITWHSNPCGTNSKTYWVTDNAGTGKWEWYAYFVDNGSANFSSTMFFALSGTPGTTNAPVDWFLSYANTIILSYGAYDGLRTRYADNADIWTNSRTFITALNSENSASVNGSSNVTMGVSGTLPVSHGGTGQTSIANIQAGKDADGNTITSKYVSIYNSNNIGQSSSVTVNDLAKQGSAVGMIYNSTDNPLGASKWVHVWSQAWNKGVNSSWVSQIAAGVGNSDGLYYRTTQGNVVGTTWKRLLDSSNYTNYNIWNKIKSNNRFYPLVGNAYGSAWYKVTWPFPNTHSSNKWMMLSMDITLGGPYGSGPSGKIQLSYYFSYNSTNAAWSVNNVYGVVLGNNINSTNIQIKYSITEPNVMYIKAGPNQYRGISIENLHVHDSAPSYDFLTTKIETCAEPDSAVYNSSVPLVFYGSDNGVTAKIDNNLTVGSSSIGTNGYIIGTWLRTTGNSNSTGNFVTQKDGWLYYRTPTETRNDIDAPSKTGLGASGTWGISISGNAATAAKFASAQSITLTGDTTGTASSQAGWSISTTTSKLSRTEHLDTAEKLDAFIEAGKLKYATVASVGGVASDGMIISVPWSSTGWGHQVFLDDSAMVMQHRHRYTKTNSDGSTAQAWSGWATLLDSSNYTNYTVTKTGSGASGTWDISVTGNALTAGNSWAPVTNGQTWSRICLLEPTGDSVEGYSGLLHLSCTRGNVVCNASFILNISHHGTSSRIVQIGGTNYSTFRIRIVTNSNSAAYVEIYDTAHSIAAGTSQIWQATWVSFGYNNITKYTTFTTGATTPSGYAAAHTLNTTSGIIAEKVYGAVWNDYAEYRQSDITEPGRVVIENGDGTLSLSTKRLQRGAEIISDTFGFAIGETDECKTPIAATGRVLAYTYEPIEEYKSKIGWPVCSGPNGTVSIMSEEEEEKYPSRIIGTISEIPTYEEWGTGKVKVDGRVWIRIK